MTGLALLALASAWACGEEVVLSRSPGATGQYCADACSVEPVGGCGLVPDCGCACGETCDQGLTSGVLACRPVGSAAEGALCSAPEDCEYGLTCLIVDEDGLPGGGVCLRPCRSDADCNGTVCEGFSALPPGVGVCTSDCDPVADTGCPAPLICRAVPRGRIDGTLAVLNRCHEEGIALRGQLCEWHEECASGLVCLYGLPRVSEHICASSCGADADCGGRTCVAYEGLEGRPLSTEVGTCEDECDPLSGAGCAGALVCRPSVTRRLDGAYTGFAKCLSAGPGLPNEPCTRNEDCMAGHGCTFDLCRELCVFPEGICPPATTCTRSVFRTIVGGIEYGVCLP